MPKNDNSENKQQVENLTKALAVYAAKQELVVGQKKANDAAAETHDIVVKNQKIAKKLDPTVKKGISLPVVIKEDESKGSIPELGSIDGSGNDYVDKLERRADKSAGKVDDVKSAKNKLALMEAEDDHNEKWAPALKLKADAEALSVDPAGFLKKVLLQKMMLAFSEKARAQEKVDKDDERLAAANAAAARHKEADALREIVEGTAEKEKEITSSIKEASEIDVSKDESIGTALSATPDATFDDPLTELNSSGEEQVDILKTQSKLLEKLVSSSEDDGRISAAEELANESKKEKKTGKGILSVVKDKKDKDSDSLSDMFGKKSSFGKMFGKKGSFGKMFGGKGKMGGLGGKGKMGGGMMGKAGGLMSKLPMGGLGGMASAAMGGLGSLGSMASAAAVANPIGAAVLGAAALGAGGYMLYDSFRGSDESKDALDAAEEAGAVEHNIFGSSQVLDWDKVKAMSPEAIQDLSDYDDWDSKTAKGFAEILNPKVSSPDDLKDDASTKDKAMGMKSADTKKLIGGVDVASLFTAASMGEKLDNDQLRLMTQYLNKEQDVQRSQGLDQMNQTALSNKTAGMAQGAASNQQPTNITTDNSVVNNTSITENKSHDADPSAQYLNRRSGSPLVPSFT